MVDVRREGSRFTTEAPGVTTRHSFSFGTHYDPANVGHAVLVAHNDDRVEPGHGYDLHPHADLEIVTWVLSGALRHTSTVGSGVIGPGEVQQVLLAGSFGSYLSPAAAVRIGLVPKLPVLRIVSAGNVAGEGAKMALLSLRERAGAVTLCEEVAYVELSDRSDFNDRFVDRLAFP